MIAAPASVATPIGRDAGALVCAPGGRRFTDHVRVGAPLNPLAGVAAAPAIPLIWLQGGEGRRCALPHCGEPTISDIRLR